MSDEVFEVCGETMFSGSYSALVTTERPPSALELGSNPGVGNARVGSQCSLHVRGSVAEFEIEYHHSTASV